MKIRILNIIIVGFRNMDGKLIINILNRNEHDLYKRLLYQIRI